MSASEDDVKGALLTVATMDADQLTNLQHAIAGRREVLNSMQVHSLRPGMKVKWSGRNGAETGTIFSVKQKWVEVTPDVPIPGKPGVRWNVRAGALVVTK